MSTRASGCSSSSSWTASDTRTPRNPASAARFASQPDPEVPLVGVGPRSSTGSSGMSLSLGALPSQVTVSHSVSLAGTWAGSVAGVSASRSSVRSTS